jgi:CheY-like chemotaxis protein
MSQRVLFVDDEKLPRKAAASLLRKNGYEVFEADNGRDAMAQLLRKPVDLVITDMIMPEMDGIETILAVRGRYPGIKIIAAAETKITPVESHLKIARVLGSHKTLVKPLDKTELLDAVRELIG